MDTCYVFSICTKVREVVFPLDYDHTAIVYTDYYMRGLDGGKWTKVGFSCMTNVYFGLPTLVMMCQIPQTIHKVYSAWYNVVMNLQLRVNECGIGSTKLHDGMKDTPRSGLMLMIHVNNKKIMWLVAIKKRTASQIEL
mmetsp:Transcript_6519/g.14084  ORF Transcript_6519/g.14084 Transcript_6519/m.14084 type:complete len:138 (+) Transcript_6519:1006-1419(+)